MQNIKLLLLAIVLIGINPAVSTGNPADTQEPLYGPVKSGEMLWKIAAKVRPDTSVSREQVIMAMLKANPLAFSAHCNFNSLKVGVKLRVPPLAEMQTIDAEDAKAEVNRQSKAWKNRSKQPIACAETTPTVAPPPPEPSPADTSSPAVPSAASPPTTPSVTLSTEATQPPPVSPPTAVSSQPAKAMQPIPIPARMSLSPPSDSSLMLLILAGGGLLAAFIIGWLLHKHIKSCADVAPTDQMPLRHEKTT